MTIHNNTHHQPSYIKILLQFNDLIPVFRVLYAVERHT